MNIDSIQRAVDYIEHNLHTEIKLAAIAQAAGYSMYHFDKLFKYAVGDSVIEYVRKRRLTEAARDLVATSDRIIDIAVKYGFGSQQAFTLAFKANFNLPPAQYRRNKKQLSFYTRKVLTRDSVKHLSRGISKEPLILAKSAFHATGLEYYGASNHGEIPALWRDFLSRLPEIPNRRDSHCTMGICGFVRDYDPVQSEFSYLACTEVADLDHIPPGLLGRTIPGGKYAVFTHRGDADLLEETYRYIYGIFFPRSDLKLAEKADFEVYGRRYSPGRGDSEIDIYIPVE